jgi:hypothetical protein
MDHKINQDNEKTKYQSKKRGKKKVIYINEIFNVLTIELLYIIINVHFFIAQDAQQAALFKQF